MKDSQKRLLTLGAQTMWLGAWSGPGNHERNFFSSMRYPSHQEGLVEQEREFKLIWQEKYWYLVLATVEQLHCTGIHNCLWVTFGPNDQVINYTNVAVIVRFICWIFWFIEIKPPLLKTNPRVSWSLPLPALYRWPPWLNDRTTISLWDTIFKFKRYSELQLTSGLGYQILNISENSFFCFRKAE